jgi:hypothetical protein
MNKTELTMKTMKYLLMLTLMMAFVGCSNPNEKKAPEEATSDNVKFLLVQNAAGITLSDGQLRLKNIAPTTLYFSDRPDRIVGRVTTQEYVDHWAVGDNNFKADPPNAVISMISGTEAEDITVVLTEPRLEGADLLYNVEVLDGSTNIVGGEVALFIDIVGRPLTPLSVAGVARRTTRRTARRIM